MYLLETDSLHLFIASTVSGENQIVKTTITSYQFDIRNLHIGPMGSNTKNLWDS